MKRFTKKLWFGKKRFGWGSRPVSPEGWLVTLIFVAAVFFDVTRFKWSLTGIAIFVLVLVIFIIIVRLTGEIGSESFDKKEK